MFDTHAHVNFNAFKNDYDEVIKRALEKNVSVINVGSQYSTSVRAVEMAQNYDNVYAAVGLHPIQLEDMKVEEGGVEFITRKEEFDYNKYKELAADKKVIAIGEAGLDYFHIPEELDREVVIEKQKKAFQEQINLANELQLPMIVHVRNSKIGGEQAYIDILAELKKTPLGKAGVMHCYGGPLELVDEFLALGMYVSFNGIITFDKTGRVVAILNAVPDDRILIETDCPYLTPVPNRGKRNEPAYVEHVIAKVAELKKMSPEEIEKMTDENAKRLFQI